jgi:hypothetical protein
MIFLKIINRAILPTSPLVLPIPMPQTCNPSRPSPPHRPRPRRATAERTLRILERLTAGASVAAVACAEGLTHRRVRQLVAAMLAERAVDPPRGFVPLQVGRLNDAMTVAHAKMMKGDLQALDRVVKIVGELDRYHGFGCAETAPSPAPLSATGAMGRRPLEHAEFGFTQGPVLRRSRVARAPDQPSPKPDGLSSSVTPGLDPGAQVEAVAVSPASPVPGCAAQGRA